jgi:ABC-type transporter Mla subunit MlaD
VSLDPQNRGDSNEHRGINTDRLKLEIRRASAPFVLMILLWVGGLLALADIIDNLHGVKPWKSYTHYQVAFSSVKGVVPGRVPVEVAGVNAGAVTGSTLVHGQAVLTVALQKGFGPLYRNAQWRLRPVTPLENLYLDITSRGTPSAGKPPKGFVFPTSDTTSEVQVGAVLDLFDPVTRQRLSDILDELGAALPDHGVALRNSFIELGPFLVAADHFATGINAEHAALAELVHNFGRITHTLAGKDTQLSRFVLTTEQTLTELAHEDAPFNSTLQALPPLLSNLQSSFSALQSAEGHIDPALTALRPVANALPSGLNGLRQIANDFTPALKALKPSVRSLVPFASALQPTTGYLEKNVDEFQTTAPQLDHTTQQLVPCEYMVDHFLNDVPSMAAWNDSVDGDNYNAFIRANVVVSASEVDDVEHIGESIEPPCFTPGGFTGP